MISGLTVSERHLALFGNTYAVSIEGQLAVCRNGGIELPQRARRCVTGIDEFFFLSLALLQIKLFEIGFQH